MVGKHRLMRRPQDIPLSYAQGRVLELERRRGGRGVILSLPVHLTGRLDVGALDEALSDLLNRHEMLRTLIRKKDGVLCQYVPSRFSLRRLADPNESERKAADEISEFSNITRMPFDLDAEIPLRAALCSLDRKSHILLLAIHKVAIDAWSLAPLVNDLSEAYIARCKGEVPTWLTCPMQYADYTLHQREMLNERNRYHRRVEAQCKFWRRTLAGLPKKIALPVEVSALAAGTSGVGEISIRFNPSLHKRLVALAKTTKTTLFMILHAGIVALLTRWGAGGDIPIATVVPCRRRGSFKSLIGMVSNTLVLRSDSSGNPTFRQLLARIRTTQTAAFANGGIPYAYLVGRVIPNCAKDTRFVQVMASLRSIGKEGTRELPALTMVTAPVSVSDEEFDLKFDLVERRGVSGSPCGVEGSLEYDTALFDRRTLERLISQLVNLLESVLKDPDQAIDCLSLEERRIPTCGRIGGIDCASENLDRDHEKGQQAYVAPQQPLHHQLIEIWEEVLGMSRIGIRDSFEDLGGNSLLCEEICKRIERNCRIRILPASFTDSVTVEGLADKLVRGLPRSRVLRVRRGNPKVRRAFFFWHGDFSGGGVYSWPLAQHLPVDQPFYNVQPHGLYCSEVPSTIEEMAQQHLEAIRAVQQEGPYLVGGHCAGGLVAFEVARRLQMAGEALGLVALLHVQPPQASASRIRSQAGRGLSPRLGSASSPQRRSGWVFSRYIDAVARYSPKAYSGRVVLLWPREDYRLESEPKAEWAKLAGEVDFRLLPGGHHTCLTLHGQELGKELKELLEAAQG
jgi:Condensation domain/Thioesterase domain/Phosphopantetheine attachment site